LRELLTIKSDDVIGRTQAYSSIIQGKPIPESNVPETFKLLVRQMNGLGLGLEPIVSEEVVEAEEESEGSEKKVETDIEDIQKVDPTKAASEPSTEPAKEETV